MALSEANHSGGVALSSIALLQERFRQLQRMRELRQEKDLLRKISDNDRCSPPRTTMHHYEPGPKTILASELIFLPPKPHCQLSLSLWPDSTITSRGTDQIKIAPSNPVSKSWFADALPKDSNPGINLGNSDSGDIDTSLRL